MEQDEWQIQDVVYCPTKFLGSLLNNVNYPCCKEFSCFKSPLLKGQPGALDPDAGERSSAVCWCDGFWI